MIDSRTHFFAGVDRLYELLARIQPMPGEASAWKLRITDR